MAPKDRTGLEKWGTALAAAREAAGMTVRQLAEATNFAPATISNYEHGHRMPRKKEIAIIEGALGVKGRLQAHFDELVNHELSPEWSEWRDIEENALRLLSYDNAVIPGLLQTEAYARAVLAYERASPLDLEQRVAERLDRQKIFERANPPTAVFIIDESVLRNEIGSREAMYEQVSRLIEMARRPNVIIHIIPEKCGYHPGLNGAFMIAKLPEREVAFQDGIWTGHVLREDKSVSALGDDWQHILAKAWNAADSLELMEREVEKWKN